MPASRRKLKKKTSRPSPPECENPGAHPGMTCDEFLEIELKAWEASSKPGGHEIVETKVIMIKC